MKKNRLLSLFVIVSALLLSSNAYTQDTLTIGMGSSSSSTRGPFQRSDTNSSSVYSRNIMLFTAAELSAAGIMNGDVISELQWEKGNSNIIIGTGNANIKLYLKNSTNTATISDSWTNLISGSTLVLDSNFNTTNNFPASSGWMPFPLNNSFVYTGGALEIGIDWDGSQVSTPQFGGNGSVSWRWQATTGNTLVQRVGSSSPPTNITNLKSERANTRMIYTSAAMVCNPPSNLNAVASSSTSANLSWSSSSNALTYNWKVVNVGAGSSATAIDSANTTDTTAMANGLSALTAYDLFVQADCGGTGTSNYSGPYTFVTQSATPLDTLTIGVGTSSSSTRGPFQRSDTNSSSVFSRAILLFTAAELANAGIVAGETITELQWEKGNSNVMIGSGNANMKVYLQNSTDTVTVSDSWTNYIAGSSLVLNRDFNTTNNFPASSGWMSFALDIPFSYTGGSIEIAVDWDASAVSTPQFSGNGSVTWRWQATSFNSLANRTGSSSAPSTISTLRSERANTRMIYTSSGTTSGINSFPYSEDFESGDGGFVVTGTNPSWEFGLPAGTVISTNICQGDSAWVTNLTGSYNNNENSQLESPTFDFSSLMTDPILRFDHNYETEGCCDEGWVEVSTDGGTSWTKLGTASSGINNWYNDSGNDWWDGSSSGWRVAAHTLTGLAGQANVKIRFVFSSDGSVTREGFGVDNILITDGAAIVDPEMTSFVSPAGTLGAFGSTDTVEVSVLNSGSSTLSAVDLCYIVDGNTPVCQTFALSLAPGASTSLTFSQTADLSAIGNHTISSYIQSSNDFVCNDTISVNITTTSVINSFPYIEDFEADAGNWSTTGTNSTWAHGIPAGSVINSSAGCGAQAWVTNLTGNYNNNENSQLESPTFDFSGLATDPIIRFDYNYITESCCDEGWVETSIDGGITWTKLGTASSGISNWYNDSGNDWWDGSSNGWRVAAHLLTGLAGQANVKVRFVFSSDGSVSRDGFAVDNIVVAESFNDPQISALITPSSLSGGFTSAEVITASISNAGTDTLTSIQLCYAVDGGTPTCETFTTNIAPLSTDSLTFATTANLAAGGAHTLDVYVGSTNDYLCNDSLSVNITTIVCPVPSINSAVSVTENAATISWIEGGMATSWEVEWDTIGYTPGMGNNAMVVMNDTFLMVTGLMPNTDYEWNVRAICAPTDTSARSMQGSFRTAAIIPYAEDFETFPSGQNIGTNGWTNSQGSIAPDWTADNNGTSSGATGPDVDHTLGTSAGIYIYMETSSPASTGDRDTLSSAPISVGIMQDSLTLNYWYHMAGATMGDLQVWVETNGVWDSLTTYSGAQQSATSDPWLLGCNRLNGYAGQTIALQFIGERGSSFTGDMAVDDISIIETLPCMAPFANMTSNVGIDTADVSWIAATAGSNAKSYIVEWDSAGFIPGSGSNSMVVTDTFMTITGLSALTMYEYNVRAICAPGDTSDASNTIAFTTAMIPTPFYSIATLNTEDLITGVADSLGVTAWTSGTVVGIDLDGNAGISFTIVDDTTGSQEGINVFNFVDVSNYVVNEGDDILLRGTVGQFNGLTQFVPDSIVLVSQGNLLPTPIVVNTLDETTESKWLGVTSSFVALSNGGGTAGSNFNLDLSDGTDTITMRVDRDTDIDDSLAVAGAILAGDTVMLNGVGGQFDSSNPFTDGYQILPMRWIDITIIRQAVPPPPVMIPYYPIGVINTEDPTTGVADSLGVEVSTSGTVVGIDLDGNNGYSFYIIDQSSGSQEGINVFNFNDVSGYVVAEGDSITVYGDIAQFNGLTEIIPDSISVINNGAAIPTTVPVTTLDESTEARWLNLATDFWALDSTNGTFSQNIDITNGTDTLTMRIDSDTDILDSLVLTPAGRLNVGDTICGLIGIGAQFDNSNPFTDGYQIFPMRWSDVMICPLITGIDDIETVNNTFSIYPNPNTGQFVIETTGFNNASVNIMVRDLKGRIVRSEAINNANSNFTKSFDLSGNAKGVYIVTIQDGGNLINKKLIIQ